MEAIDIPDPITAVLHILAAMSLSMMDDPLVWLALAGSLVLGVTRRTWLWVLPLAAGATGIDTVPLVLTLGTPDAEAGPAGVVLFLVGVQIVALCIVCGIGWGIGRAAAPLMPGAMSTGS